MDGSSTVTGSETPIERFKPTSGFAFGYIAIALMLVALVYVVTSVHTVTGLRVGLATVFAAVLVWATQIRPRAHASHRTLTLKNSFIDFHVPLTLIDTVTIRHTLNVWVGDERYVCIGIGEGMRARRKDRGDRPSMLGTSRWHEFSEMADKAGPEQRATSYQSWIVRRIEELVQAARKAQRSGGSQEPPPTVRRTAATPELVALGVTGVTFVLSLFV